MQVWHDDMAAWQSTGLAAFEAQKYSIVTTGSPPPPPSPPMQGTPSTVTPRDANSEGQKGHPAPLASQSHIIPTHFPLNLHGM
jgi:hypothetical protein